MGRRSHIGNQHRRRLLDPQQWGIATRSAVVSAVVVLVALILAGAAIFAGTLYGISMLDTPAALAPVGGITLLAGWIVLAFAKPGK